MSVAKKTMSSPVVFDFWLGGVVELSLVGWWFGGVGSSLVSWLVGLWVVAW